MAEPSDRHRAAREALRTSVLDSPGRLASSVRHAAYEDAALDLPLGSFVGKVRRDSARVTDADIEALRSAGLSEDEVFELTLAASLGAATAILERGLDLLGRGPT